MPVRFPTSALRFVVWARVVTLRTLRTLAPAASVLLLLSACDSGAQVSVRLATQEVQALTKAAAEDVRQIRAGLPLGAEQLAIAYKEAARGMDPESARRALGRAREKVPDLRVAKSTFFALVTPEGTVL